MKIIEKHARALFWPPADLWHYANAGRR